MIRNVWLGVMLLAVSVSAQTPPADGLALLRPLTGRWQGTSEGEPGKATVEREYTELFGRRFIHVRNRSTYAPQEKNPKGETHEDVGVFSFDKARARVVFRQFHTEGFVNQYVLDPDAKPERFALTTEAIENIGPGWRARETYVLRNKDELEEIFELAPPGGSFAVYSHARLTRVK
jgi:hypothetical protein